MIDRHTFPSHGWQFFDPALKWNAPSPMGNTFDQTVELIIKARLKNPALVAKHKLATDRENVGNELEAFTRARLGMGPVDFPKSSPPSLSAAAAGAVAAVKKIAAGASLLFEWEESGIPPVSKEQADKRAHVCSICPRNQPGHLTKYFTEPISKRYAEKFQKLHAMKLVTSDHEKLGVCTACLCPLALKAFAPLSLILSHLRPDSRTELVPECWILSEERAAAQKS